MTQLPSYRVRVSVCDSSGVPVPGATVEVIQFSHNQIFLAQTDGDGVAFLDIPAGADIHNVVALKNGAGFDYFENPRCWPSGKRPNLPHEVSLVLNDAVEVQVRTIDSAGRFVPDVPLTPWTIKRAGKLDKVNCSGRQATTAWTDQAGVARFGWVPTDLEGVTQFVVGVPTYHCPRTAWIDPAHPCRLLTARLLRATRVSGRVLYADGSPAVGISVLAEGRGQTNFYCRCIAKSGPDGGYELLLWPDQSYLLTVEDDAMAARSLRGVVVREGQTLVGLDLSLTKGTRLRGRVTVGPDHKVAAGQTVTVLERGMVLDVDLRGHSQQEELARWARTDEAGRYEIRLAPGRYWLRGPDPAPAEELTLDSEEEVVRDFSLPWPGRGLLTGKVRRAGGESVSHAVVLAYSVVRGHAWLETNADAEGRFSGERWRDRMLVYARDIEGVEAGSIEIDEQVEEVAVVVSPAATARGRVVDDRGNPRCNESVFCRMRAMLSDETSVSFQFDTRTNEAGIFAFPGLLVDSSCDVVVLKGFQPISPRHAFKVMEIGVAVLPDLVVKEPGPEEAGQ